MKSLNGKELSEFIKERQAKVVRSLRQSSGIVPKLAIVQCIDDPVINTYVRLKKRYGADILVEVEHHQVDQPQVPALLRKLNADDTIHGIIVQLPLVDPSETDKIVELVAPEKDVDALGSRATFEPATPTAILWLLSGYNVELHQGKKVLLIGRGKLVGAPLERMLQVSGVDVTVVTRSTSDLSALTRDADVIITATGQPGILHADMIKNGAAVVDAGVASEDGKTVGDVAADVYERDDLTLTPQKGGVGPLTVCALFENVTTAARRVAENTQEP